VEPRLVCLGLSPVSEGGAPAPFVPVLRTTRGAQHPDLVMQQLRLRGRIFEQKTSGDNCFFQIKIVSLVNNWASGGHALSAFFRAL
jgi:hypothetical protein